MLIKDSAISKKTKNFDLSTKKLKKIFMTYSYHIVFVVLHI